MPACLYAGGRSENLWERASAFGLGIHAGRQTCGSDQPTRRASDWPTAGYKTTICDEINRLTDGWNYEKVVVGSNLRAEV